MNERIIEIAKKCNADLTTFDGEPLAYTFAIANLEKFAELLSQNEPVVIEIPDYHSQAMGCGLEDRNITDCYEAMAYGWECAVERVFEQIPDEPLFLSPPQPQEVADALEAAAKICEDMQSEENKAHIGEWCNYGTCQISGHEFAKAIRALIK